jgi:hypothetical protein
VLDSDLGEVAQARWSVPAQLPADAAIPGLAALAGVNAIVPVG